MECYLLEMNLMGFNFLSILEFEMERFSWNTIGGKNLFQISNYEREFNFLI